MKAVMSKNLKATLADKTASDALRGNLTRSEDSPFNISVSGQIVRFRIGSVELSLPPAKKSWKAAA